jgi:hypothetical protein
MDEKTSLRHDLCRIEHTPLCPLVQKHCLGNVHISYTALVLPN